MFAWWGTVVSRLRWLVLVAAAGFLVFGGVWGTGVFGAMTSDASLSDPDSESQRIVTRITDEVGSQATHLVALYSSDTMAATDPGFRKAVTDVVARLRADPSVEAVSTYYETQAPPLLSTDHHATYLPIRMVEGTDAAGVRRVADLLPATGLRTQVGGSVAINMSIDSQVGDDVGHAEMIAMPVLLVLLVLIFGSLVAAAMPLLVGGIAIIGAFTAVRMITLFTDVSTFAINIITILGLGLAVDYGLFIVSRFREELDRGHPVEQAVSRTLATAGRTVAISGAVVTLALSGLLIFPQILLRSMGLGAAAAVLVAMLTSLTVLPAMLAVLGKRIDALRLPWARRRVPSLTGTVANASGGKKTDDGSGGVFGRIAHSVMRRPAMYTIGVAAVLLLLAVPITKVQFGGIDERVLPADTESRVVSERVRTEFPGGNQDPIVVLVSGAAGPQVTAFADRIEALPDVHGATVSAHRGSSTVLNVDYAGDRNSTQARQVVDGIRGLPRPPGAEVMVGGSTAVLVDQLAEISDRIGWMALFVAGVTLVLLTLAFGSVVVALKAILMNVISISAAFGVVVWTFQDGKLAGPLDFTATGYLDASQPILMMAILFGLSMDYEVFLLSRVREQWDRLGDNTAAVAVGVQRTGRIITSAALLLCVVVGAFAMSGITFIKMVGVGMLVALALDAVLVRLLLVPATMRLLGKHNWWAPKFVRVLYSRFGLHEDDGEEDDPAERREHSEPTAWFEPPTTPVPAAVASSTVPESGADWEWFPARDT
ncbi:RND superfamily putative drug exporter [Labedaea rhizosphaerae]|uniref:RND superfamily putative drug exporter n=2 Tax=Labedaea rhizosphaerae TaxID=598644 RepID=A0A4R6SFI6_LABRH|nr:RND superfamily putative drug exporter [Labedaea rhizosphaerae]